MLKLNRVLSAAVILGLATTFFVGCTKKVDDKDNTINAAIRANVKGLDPLQANDMYSSTVIQNIYEGLYCYHYLKRPYELQPCIADGMPVASDNGLTQTIKLKKGILFQDNAAFADGKGREVTAEDFIYSWKRLADPKNQSEGFWVFDGKIKGLNEWAALVKEGKASYDTPVEGLQAPDKYTLVIKLTQTYYQLYYTLAMPFTVVVPKEAVTKYGAEFLNNPIGSGPFSLESWTRNSKITLKRNPTYREETYPSEGAPGDKEAGLLADAGKKIPFADKLVITELPEDNPRWLNFQKGNFEFIEIPNDNFDSTVKNKELLPEFTKKGIRLDISPELDVTYIGLNMKDPILGKNKFLRQALATAYNNKEYISKFLNNRGVEAQGPLPPNIGGYDSNVKKPYEFDIAKAKDLLTKAGFPGGKGLPELVYEAMSDSKGRQIAEHVQQAFAAIGVKLQINANTWPQFQEKIKGQKAQIFGVAWGADYPDGQNFLQLFYSKNLPPGPNDTNFTNSEFDKLYEQSLKLPPSGERDQLYSKMQKMVNEESPWIYNAHRVRYSLYHGWLNNYKWNSIGNDYFKYLRVDPVKRAELKPKL